MGKIGRYAIMSVLGITIVILTILHQTGVISLNGIIISWWPVILILTGIIFFIQEPWTGESISCLLIGVIFLIKQLDLLSAQMVIKLFWPCIIIIVGLSCLFARVKNENKNKA